MNDDKIWVNGAFFKKKTFNNGGHIHTMWSPNVDELCQWLQANKKPNGTISINISGSKEPRIDEYGNEKLNATLDTWQSQPQQQQTPVPAMGQAGYKPQAPTPQPQGVDASMAPPAQPYQAPQQAVPVSQPQTPPVPQPVQQLNSPQLFDANGQPIVSNTDIPY